MNKNKIGNNILFYLIHKLILNKVLNPKIIEFYSIYIYLFYSNYTLSNCTGFIN